MQIWISQHKDEVSEKAAKKIVELLQPASSPLICIASGDSPKGIYKEFASLKKSVPAIMNWNYVGLDEWVGMNETTEGSCSFHLMNDLINPLEIKKEKLCLFNGSAENLEKECDRIENFISEHNGIDVAIVGLGLNGHIAMNDPGTSRLLRSHVSVIAKQTQETGQKYFTTPRPLTHGITIGLATLMEARFIILIALGSKKAGAVKQMLTAEKSEQVPSTLIRGHPGLTIYLDEEAAAFIPNELR
ncbi:MAG: glucosamine/galactosamine-6-phosphateisomerase [Chitinophagaceae bacterium]|nr:glucosamine/galactosamine-6-phosphateisomerase [Chitinophagaceae bacterium]